MSDSLRDTLRAAMSGEAAAPPEPVITPDNPEPARAAGDADAVSGQPLVPEPAPKAEARAEPAKAEDATEGPKRGPDGKFAPKDDTAPAAEGAQAAAPKGEEPKPSTETAQPAEKEPQSEATPIPPSLSAAVKAQWNDLPPAVRKDFSRLEESVQTAKAEWGRKGERLNRFEEIVGPHVPKWQMNGLDAYSGIQTLIAAQQVLDANPVQGLVQIARSYGLTPAHLAQAFGLTQANGQQPSAEGGQAPTGAPDISAALQQHLAPVLQQVQTLQRELQTSRQATEAEQMATAQAEVEAFKNDPANLYFENVRGRVAALLEAKQAASLADAYQMAIWADPEVRPLLLKQQQDEAAKAASAAAAKAQREAEEAARTKAAQAQRAAGSVTGAPAPGSEPPAGRSSGNLRQDLIAARDQVSARA